MQYFYENDGFSSVKMSWNVKICFFLSLFLLRTKSTAFDFQLNSKRRCKSFKGNTNKWSKIFFNCFRWLCMWSTLNSSLFCIVFFCIFRRYKFDENFLKAIIRNSANFLWLWFVMVLAAFQNTQHSLWCFVDNFKNEIDKHRCVYKNKTENE